MSKAIPQTDAALLAAQAQAGQAGVDAYEAAKKEMAKSRQMASSDALAAAANRGAPAGAQEAAMAGANQMYDRRDAALTTAQAAYEDAMASRKARMADYNAGVGEARSLIGDQVAQTVAPIDAQTRYRVSDIEARGRMTVDQINAQARLEQLRLEGQIAAAARAGAGRGGGGGGGGGSTKKPSLSQTELAAGVTARGTSNLQRARQAAESAMRQTAEQSRQAASYTGQSVNNDLRESLIRAGEIDRVADGRAEAARQAVSYTGRAVQEWEQQQENKGYLGGPNASFGLPGKTYPQPEEENPYLAAARQAFSSAAGASGRNRQPTGGAPTGGVSAAQQAALAMSPLYGQGQSFFTPSQFDDMAMGPDMSIYEAMMSAGGLQRIGGIGERLGFDQIDPTSVTNRINPMTGAPYRRGDMTDMNPTGQEALRRAMWQAGVDMEAEGYKIDANELQNVLDSDNDIYKPGDSVYDVEQRRMGGETYSEQRKSLSDQISAQEQQAIDAEDRDWTNSQRAKTIADDEAAAIETAAEEQLVAQFGLAPSVPGLTSTQVYSLLADEDNLAVFNEQLAKLDAARIEGLKWDEVYTELLEGADEVALTPADRAMLTILEQLY